jgi:hypothetical protein
MGEPSAAGHRCRRASGLGDSGLLSGTGFTRSLMWLPTGAAGQPSNARASWRWIAATATTRWRWVLSVPPTAVHEPPPATIRRPADRRASSWKARDWLVRWALRRACPSWVRVHMLPDYLLHSVHLAVGVGCVSCHGRIDQMPVVNQVSPLSMSWCLACHRDPAPHLRPEGVAVTQMDWVAAADHAPPVGPQGHPIARNGREVLPPLHCSGCHR